MIYIDKTGDAEPDPTSARAADSDPPKSHAKT